LRQFSRARYRDTVFPESRWPDHYLTRLKGQSAPANVVALGVSAWARTRGKTQTRQTRGLLCGHVCAWRADVNRTEESEFTQAGEFWAALRAHHRAKTVTYVVAYDLARALELVGLRRRIEDGELSFYSLEDEAKLRRGEIPEQADGWRGFAVLGDPPSILHVREDWRTFTLLDVRNYWDAPLAEYARWVGCDKAIEADGSQDLWTGRREARQRARLALAGFVGAVRWWREADLGRWGWTVGACALNSFRADVPRKHVLIDCHEQATRLARSAIVGGEQRALYVGQAGAVAPPVPGSLWSPSESPPGFVRSTVHVLDVVGCYAGVMQNQLLPVKVIGHWTRLSVDQLRRWSRAHLWAAEVAVTTRERTYPVLVKDVRYYATGKYVTTLCGPELARALEHGDVTRVERAACWRGSRVFQAWTLKVWALYQKAKADGDQLIAKLCKSLLVSLPGKFAQKESAWTLTGEVHPEAGWFTFPRLKSDGRTVEELRVLGRAIERAGGRLESDHSLPAVNAFVCAYARDQLRRLREACPPASVLYQHTDSLHVTDAGLQALTAAGEVGAGELGRLELRGSAATAEYRGLSDYTLDGVHSIAGADYSAAHFERGRAKIWREESWDSFVSRSAREEYGARLVEVQLGRLHPRAVVGQYGWTTPVRVVAGALAPPYPPEEASSRKRRNRREDD
jgi:hypothetical protein